MHNDSRVEDFERITARLNCCCNQRVIELKLNAILELLICIHTGKAVDLNIVFGLTSPTTSKGTVMANKKANGSPVKLKCLAPQGGASIKAVMPDVTLTDPLPKSITLQPLDASGNVVVLDPADNVQGTLTSSAAHLTVAQSTDSLNYTGTIPANTPQGSVADLTATLKGTIKGAAADLTASVHVTIDVPPSPVAVDLAIIFGS